MGCPFATRTRHYIAEALSGAKTFRYKETYQSEARTKRGGHDSALLYFKDRKKERKDRKKERKDRKKERKDRKKERKNKKERRERIKRKGEKK